MTRGTGENRNLFATISAGISDPERLLIQPGPGEGLSYGGMLARSAQYANALTRLGVKPGDRIAVQVDKSLEAILLYLGAVRAGAIYLPLNTAYTEAELDYFIGDAEPSLVVSRPEKMEALGAIAKTHGVAHLETLGPDGKGGVASLADGEATEFGDVVRGEDDLAAILYTSGTTGRSKGAMLSHGNLASNAETLREYWQFTGDDVLIHALPIFHTHGLFVATNTVLLAGASMIFLSKFDLDAVIGALPRATAMMGVPTFYTRLLSDDRFDRDLVDHMRLFVSGSAPLSPETHKAFEARTGHAILERYGMTETNMNTSNPYDGARRPGTVGFPLPGVEIRIADRETGEPVPEGDTGIVEIRGPNVFKGYWRMPEKTAAEFRKDGFFISGDLGRIDDRGYLNLVGRDKDLVISGGFNVYPAEVEAAIDALDGVAESAVIGVPHPDLGEGVTAVVVAEAGAEPTTEAIRQRLSTELAGYKVPKKVFVVDELPKNAMGKVQKKNLRETYKDAYGAQ